MYFEDRVEAGARLAVELADYREQPAIVMSLSESGIVVGWEIARLLKCPLVMLLTDAVNLPGNIELGAVDQAGGFVYNNMISPQLTMSLLADMHNAIEEEKVKSFFALSSSLSSSGLIDKEQLKDRHVIVTTDGAESPLLFEAALGFSKAAAVRSRIAAIPVAPASVVEQLQQRFDKVICLSRPPQFYGVDHYYTDNRLPSPETIWQLLRQAGEFEKGVHEKTT